MLARRMGSRQKGAKLKRISFGKSGPRESARWRSANRETEAAGRVRIGRSGPVAFGGESVRKGATSLQRDRVACDITSWPKKRQQRTIRHCRWLSRRKVVIRAHAPAPTMSGGVRIAAGVVLSWQRHARVIAKRWALCCGYNVCYECCITLILPCHDVPTAASRASFCAVPVARTCIPGAFLWDIPIFPDTLRV